MTRQYLKPPQSNEPGLLVRTIPLIAYAMVAIVWGLIRMVFRFVIGFLLGVLIVLILGRVLGSLSRDR